MRILQIVFLLSICGCSQARNITISEILEIEKLSKDVTKDLFKTFALLDEDVRLSPKESKSVLQNVLFKEFKVFKNKIDMFNAQLGPQVLDAMVRYTDIQFQLKPKLEKVNENIDFIFVKYEDMGTFMENKTALAFLRLTLEDYARFIVSYYSNSIPSILDGIHAIIAPSEDGVPSVFAILIEIMKVQGNKIFCNLQMSEQQLLLNLYNTLVLTELKGFLLVEFSYMILKLNGEGNITKEIEAAQERYNDRSGITLKLAIEAVQSAPREFWKCDPEEHVQNETYIEITEQGINFNMRSSESDIDHNKVVTGLRFVKKNRIIHLQIQQGKLLPGAQIDGSTVQWKPVEDYKIDDRKIFNGQDYHTLTWEKRNFDLDDLVTKEEELLTGVRFALIGSHLNFQIRLTPFNFTTGTLEVGTSKWKHNEVSDKNRKKVNLDNKDIPVRSLNHSLPVSKSRMYLEFTHTDLCMDVAQTTVPFIDAQAVASTKPVPLSGAGVMYKGFKNFGGFIGPKIMTYDYSKLLLNAYDDINYIYLQ